MLNRLSLISAAALLAASPAFAAGFAPATTPAAPVAPITVTATPPAATPDWTGFYVGGDLSYGQFDSDDIDTEADGHLTGLHAGYQRDFGRFVLGAELEHDWGNIAIDDAGLADDVTLDRVARAKLRAGYDAGRFLPYVTGGWAHATLSSDGFDDDEGVDGTFYGLGVSYQLTDRFDVGAEVLRHDFDELADTGIETQVTTIGLRGSIRF
ncbi:outer membrane protein [Rubellimicrobium aerolatum]|uniref:Outer membrane protein n=1 Tax=Rubellimicrobium aerolatum TaxID=490979 RepID=A0ABW0S7S4_9RHOB|nr:porin family protein [Rubellimicrobium aerolatum]MBP1804484.1 opacity protein-like surface antigen [Rubellimicrobium aerolatum]